MVGVGEMVASAMVKQIAGKLGDLAADEVALQWGFKDDALKMVGKMEDLEAVVHDADHKLRHGGTSGEAVERWLAKLNSVIYDVEDVLEELAATELIQKIQRKLKLFFSRDNQLYQRITVPHKIKNLRKRIEEIERDGQMLNLVHHEQKVEGSRNDETFAPTNDEVLKTQMVGRGTQVDKIINLLLKNEDNEHISVIPIVGLGGIGKTTLAQTVFVDNRVKVFDVKVWVHVSKEFNLIKIGSSIIKSINSIINLDNCTLQFLHDNLRNELATKRYLIVLDDLWEENWSELDKLKLMLPHDCKGSKVIVTTRNQSVVESLNTECTDQINLDVLSPNDCWIVMKQRAFKPGDNLSVTQERLGREIAGKCGGLPLVAKALGHVMSQLRTVEAWQAIRDTQVVQETTLERLMVSYHFMRLELKMCFTYLAAFPKGFVVDSDSLIQQWIALGYIHARFNGQICINYLLGMSFLEISRPSLVSPSLAQAKSQELTMHDLVHDLATKVMGNEFLVMDATIPSLPNIAKSRNCRHAQLINYHNQSNVFKHLPSKVRSLHFRNTSAKLPFPTKAFFRSKYIRVLNLDLSGCSAESDPTPKKKVLPSSVLKLKLLKYLDATGFPFASLPKPIHTLQNLQSLILSNSSLETLPDLICSLHKLCYLDLSGSSSLVTLPALIEEITELSFLNLSGCSMLKQLPRSICNITCLQHLDMSKCCLTKLPDSFGNLAHLLFLNLSSCSKLTKLPDNVNHESLEHLDLSSCHELETLPQDFGNLQNLVFLSFSDCYKLSMLPETFCQLVHLKDLDLSDCHGLRELPECFGNLSELDSLNLTSCSKLQILPDSFCKLFKLRHLNLSYCMRLEKLPSSIGDLKLEFLDISAATFHDLPSSLWDMTTLTQLVVSGTVEKVFDKACIIRKHLNLPGKIVHSVRQIEENGCSSIVELAQLTCRELKVKELHNVTQREDAERAKLRDKSDLRALDLAWGPQGEEDIVLERLVPPRTLEHFVLHGYMNKDFPNWMSHISTYLPSLTLLVLQNLRTCDHLPPFGQLPNLRYLALLNIPNLTKVGSEFYGDGGGACKKLRLINLESMENLVELWTTLSGEENEEFLIPNLHYLHITDCPKLRFLPYPPRSMFCYLDNSSMVLPKGGFGKFSSSALAVPFQVAVKNCNFAPHKWNRLQHLPTLEVCAVDSCNGLRALPEVFRCLTSLTKLYLWSLKDLEILPEWLGNLTSLEYIFIKDCPMLTSFPTTMKNLTALTELRLMQCNGLRALPEAVRCLTSLTLLFLRSLKDLEILPEWLGNLTSLEKFQIMDCPSVTSLPDSMKNLTNLRELSLEHVQRLEVLPEGLGNLISLSKFIIIACPSLTSLPASSRNLGALKELQISHCPILIERCQGEDAGLISHIPKVTLHR
ncbi:putative disease resistance protein RGA4 [Lolium rigidum]|uniref:putative disease resistance protein RGA4 n=1 Tax=Lolium rigidum TaxID=89674 RepID=UPI001F5C1F30|nr:putative disease resistance protein RGA4 [Lolium rigidum]